MSEIIALARLGFARSRRLITISVIYFICAHIAICCYGLSGIGDPEKLKQGVTGLLCYLSLPLLGVGLFLFDFNDNTDLGNRASAYQPWLLRSPIPSWKMAAVPIVLRTLWVMAVVLALTITSNMFGMPVVRWLIPSLAIASIHCLLSWLCWKPFRWNATRLILCVILFMPVNGWFSGAVMLSFDFEYTDHATRGFQRDTEILVASILGVSVYALIVLLSLRAVRLARFNALGLIPETSWLPSLSSKQDETSFVSGSRVHVENRSRPAKISPVGALLRYDYAKLSKIGAGIALAAWVALIALWSSADVAEISGVIVMGCLFIFPAMFVSEHAFCNNDTRFLTNLIARAPIASSAIVWTRQTAASSVWLLSVMGVPITLMIWKWKQAGGSMFRSWNASMTHHFETPDSGWRVATAIAIAVVILVVRQTTWSVAASSTGQPRYGLYSVAAKFAIGFILFSWFLYHFLQFPNWESWTEWAWRRTSEIPTILPWLLLAKLLVVCIATFALIRSRLVHHRTVVGLVLAYGLITTVGSLLIWRLIPSEAFLLWHSIALVALITPFSRIALAPMCVAYNRHQ